MTSTASGSTLTQEQALAVLLDPLLPASRFLSQLPANRLYDSADGNAIRMPIIAAYDLTGGHTAPSAIASADVWAGEGDLISNPDPTFGEVRLLDPDLQSFKVQPKFSRELARRALVGIAEALSGAVVRRLSYLLDVAMFQGTGASHTITGVLHWSGTQQQASVGSGRPTS